MHPGQSYDAVWLCLNIIQQTGLPKKQQHYGELEKLFLSLVGKDLAAGHQFWLHQRHNFLLLLCTRRTGGCLFKQEYPFKSMNLRAGGYPLHFFWQWNSRKKGRCYSDKQQPASATNVNLVSQLGSHNFRHFFNSVSQLGPEKLQNSGGSITVTNLTDLTQTTEV